MRVLHVAAMPFPTAQGTQGAVRAMADAGALAGHDVHLLTYGHGVADTEPVRFTLHRPKARLPVRSLRSGPSVGKVMLDALMLRDARRLAAELRPHLVVSHHVEGATVSLLAGLRPHLFVAHTALGPELPVYFPRALGRPLRMAGRALDRALASRADARIAVSPLLARMLEDETGHRFEAPPLPWPLRAVPDDADRHEARRALGIPDDAEVLLYAGNLDPYQGWEDVVAAASLLKDPRPNLRLLVATAADRGPLARAADHARLRDRLHLGPLDDEASRHGAHAAADVVLVPRRTPGGLPIKLLDALSRAATVVTTERATAGLSLAHVAHVVANDDPAALAHAAARALDQRITSNRSPAMRGRDYIARVHCAHRFASAVRALCPPVPPRRSPSSR